MREIKNNVELGKIQQRKEVKFGNAENVIPTMPTKDEKKVISDFSNPTAENLGRAQVSRANALNKDIQFGMNHPQSIESADKFFDMAYATLQKQNVPEAYEKACELTASYVDEFHTK